MSIDQLTFREHVQLADLLMLQSEERDLTQSTDWQNLLADACESALEPEEED